MKIAIFHNFLDNIGGAEKLVLILARELKADIYTTNIDEQKIHKMGFTTKNIFSIGKVSSNAPFRQQITLWRFRFLNLKKKYDAYIIAGDWAFSAAVHHQPILWYVHSPARELWDLYAYTRENGVPRGFRFLYDIWVNYNRYLTKKYVQRVHWFATNSLNTQKRVKKYLGKTATVVYPPVDTIQFKHAKSGKYWLSVNRLITHKRIEMQLAAFSQLPDKKLIIVGSYEQSRHFLRYKKYIDALKPPNVEILNWVDEPQLRKLYAHSRGCINTSLDEDFGMTAIEALAAGKPVIAPNEGGYKESLVSGKHGLLIADLTVPNLVTAIEKIDKDPERYAAACLKRAQEFDTGIFTKNIKTVLAKLH